MPGVATFHDPAFAHRAETFFSWWGRLDLDLPIRSLQFHPRIEAVVAIFVVSKDHLQTRLIFDRHFFQQQRRRSSVVSIRTRHHDCDQQTQHIHKLMTLPPSSEVNHAEACPTGSPFGSSRRWCSPLLEGKSRPAGQHDLQFAISSPTVQRESIAHLSNLICKRYGGGRGHRAILCDDELEMP